MAILDKFTVPPSITSLPLLEHNDDFAQLKGQLAAHGHLPLPLSKETVADLDRLADAVYKAENYPQSLRDAALRLKYEALHAFYNQAPLARFSTADAGGTRTSNASTSRHRSGLIPDAPPRPPQDPAFELDKSNDSVEIIEATERRPNAAPFSFFPTRAVRGYMPPNEFDATPFPLRRRPGADSNSPPSAGAPTGSASRPGPPVPTRTTDAPGLAPSAMPRSPPTSGVAHATRPTPNGAPTPSRDPRGRSEARADERPSTTSISTTSISPLSPALPPSTHAAPPPPENLISRPQLTAGVQLDGILVTALRKMAVRIDAMYAVAAGNATSLKRLRADVEGLQQSVDRVEDWLEAFSEANPGEEVKVEEDVDEEILAMVQAPGDESRPSKRRRL